MVAIKNIIFAVAASSVMVEGVFLAFLAGSKHTRDLEIRGSNDFWEREGMFSLPISS